jgi:hypothetical protein
MVYNVIKFQSPFERLKSYQDSPDVALRRAVIMQAIIDATDDGLSSVSKNTSSNARKWLFSQNQDFENICLEAGLEPSYVVKIAETLIDINRAKKNLGSHINLLHKVKKNTKSERNIFNQELQKPSDPFISYDHINYEQRSRKLG